LAELVWAYGLAAKSWIGIEDALHSGPLSAKGAPEPFLRFFYPSTPSRLRSCPQNVTRRNDSSGFKAISFRCLSQIL
jgi:hypothetical protein